MGKNGRGTAEHLGVEDEVDILFSTFAKSMAAIGAFVASEPFIVQFLRYQLRSQIFAKSLPMIFVEGGLKRLELIQKFPEPREKLWEITNALQNGLKERGFNIGNTQAPVTPVYLSGEPNEAMNMIYDLRENYRIFVSGVVYPVIERGIIILRMIPTAAHSLEDVKLTLEAFEAVAKKLKNGEYNTPFTREKLTIH